MIYQKIQEIELNFQIIIQLSKSILKHSPWFEISFVLFLAAYTQRLSKSYPFFIYPLIQEKLSLKALAQRIWFCTFLLAHSKQKFYYKISKNQKKETLAQVFSCDFAKVLRAPFLQNTSAGRQVDQSTNRSQQTFTFGIVSKIRF